MDATLLNLAEGRGRALELRLVKGDLCVSLPMHPPREICCGRRDKPVDGKPYVAFLTFESHDDYLSEWDKATQDYGSFTPAERLLKSIFDVEMEPELECDVVTVDGGRVVRIDLASHLPEHVVLVPEECVP